jgi:hypothetical protein
MQVDIGTLRADKDKLEQSLVANDKTQVRPGRLVVHHVLHGLLHRGSFPWAIMTCAIQSSGLRQRPSPARASQVVSHLHAQISVLQQDQEASHTKVADSLHQLHKQFEQKRATLEAGFDKERQRLRQEVAELRLVHQQQELGGSGRAEGVALAEALTEEALAK